MKIPKALKIFAQAPQIMELAYRILLDIQVPSVLADIIIEYYNCEGKLQASNPVLSTSSALSPKPPASSNSKKCLIM